MIIRTDPMRVVGILLLAAGIDALALNWSRPTASVCQGIENINATKGITPVVPAGCGPINHPLALVLALRRRRPDRRVRLRRQQGQLKAAHAPDPF